MTLFIGILFGFALGLVAVMLRRSLIEFPGQKPEDYVDGSLTFDMKTHLSGKLVCEGAIFGPLGRMTSTFVADFDVVWTGNVGVMKEHFRYDDGSTQDREWTITLGDGDRFTAVAPDVPGIGKGTQSGATMQMLYAIELPQESGGHVLQATDWMYLTPDGTIVNRSQFRKFGFRAAELVATIRPVAA